MDFDALVSSAKGKIIQLREITISPVAPQHRGADEQEIRPRLWQQAKRRLCLALVIIGAGTILCGLLGLILSPGVQRRGAEIQRLQQQFNEGKINWQQYRQGYEEALKK